MAHQIVDTKNMPIGEAQIKMSASYCVEHPGKQIKLYCYECKTVACMMCYVMKHNKHECTDVKESAIKFCEQLKDDLEKVVTYALQSQAEMKQTEINKRNFSKEVSAIEDEISQKCDRLIALIHSHRYQLMEEFNSFKVNQLKAMDSSKVEAENSLQLRTVLRYTVRI